MQVQHPLHLTSRARDHHSGYAAQGKNPGDRTFPAMEEFQAHAFLYYLAISDDPDKAITAG